MNYYYKHDLFVLQMQFARYTGHFGGRRISRTNGYLYRASRACHTIRRGLRRRRRWCFYKQVYTISVPRPAIFTEYNRNMGGTDLMHQNINTYRIGIRGKKWWWSNFTYMIDAAVCNAWVGKPVGFTQVYNTNVFDPILKFTS